MPLGRRRKSYLILILLSLILLFYSIWEIKPVIVEVDDPIGLVSHLTPAYWIGLALLLLLSIFAFLDQELRSDFIYISILLTLGLFLIGIVVFVYANTRDPDVYYANSEVYRLAAEGHFDIEALPPAAYYAWPALHIINTAVWIVTGMSGDFIQGFAKYMPLFWISFFVSITYGIGKRLELVPRWCFLLAFLPLASWWELSHYQSHSWGVLLYLLLFLLLVKTRRKVSEVVAVTLIFGALVLTHATTTFMFFLGFLLLSIYRRETRFIALFLTLFGAWYLYQATTAADQGVSQAVGSPFWQIVETARAERYQLPSAGARLFARYSQLAYLASYLALVVASAILLLSGKVAKEYRKLVISCFAWNIGVALLLGTGISPEPVRFFLFCLVPTAVIIVLSFSAVSRKLTTPIVIAVMSLTVALHLPAEYSVEAAWIQVPTSELKGSEFFVHKVKQPSLYFSANGSASKLLQGVDPEMLRSSQLNPTLLSPWPKIDFWEIHGRVEYVIISRQGVDSELFAFGELAYSAWPQTEVGKRADLFYDSGDFQLYANRSRWRCMLTTLAAGVRWEEAWTRCPSQ